MEAATGVDPAKRTVRGVRSVDGWLLSNRKMEGTILMKPFALFRESPLAPVLAVTLAMLVGCGRRTVQPPPSAPAVTVAPVEQREIIEWDEFTGRTESVESVEIRPRVSGYIQEVRFRSGQLVRKGDVLFVID